MTERMRFRISLTGFMITCWVTSAVMLPIILGLKWVHNSPFTAGDVALAALIGAGATWSYLKIDKRLKAE